MTSRLRAQMATTQLDKTTPAVILKLDRNVMHHGGLGAIRSLGRLGVPVYGVHEDPLAPAANSRYLHGRWIWQPPADDAERLRAGLVTLAQRIGRRAVLIPTDDAGAIFLAEHGTGAALMLQEHIPRRAGQDYFFHGYCDPGSRCRPAFVGIKERSYPAHAGLTSLGRWVDNPDLHRQATELVNRLGFRGIVDLDYRADPRDGQYKLLDFNPRLGAQFRLFHDTAGVDVVVAAHLDLTGRDIPPGAPRIGRRFLVENYDPIAALRYRGDGLDLRSWVASVRRVDELAWFARDDLAPFGLMCPRMGWRAMTRAGRRAPQSAPQSITPQPPARKALT